jgi:hypothetical protein
MRSGASGSRRGFFALTAFVLAFFAATFSGFLMEAAFIDG